MFEHKQFLFKSLLLDTIDIVLKAFKLRIDSQISLSPRIHRKAFELQSDPGLCAKYLSGNCFNVFNRGPSYKI